MVKTYNFCYRSPTFFVITLIVHTGVNHINALILILFELNHMNAVTLIFHTGEKHMKALI